jgi:hypothetical protein
LGQQLTDQDLPLWQAGVDAGTIIYHSDKVGPCRDALAAASCDALGSDALPAACDGVFEGTVAPAGACALNEECSGDAYCNQDAACPGACTARVGAGAACTQDQACQAGMVCGDGGTCATPVGLGATCGGPGGADCAGDTSVCLDATDTASGTCQTLAAAFRIARGDACDPDKNDFCVAGSVCSLTDFNVATSALTWICKEPSASGASCNLSFPDACPASEYCDADPETTMSFDGTCQTLPAAGMACRPGGGGDVGKACAPGLSCDGELCVAPGRLGAACTNERACVSGSCESGICVAPTCN